jgi:hypothetical protein
MQKGYGSVYAGIWRNLQFSAILGLCGRFCVFLFGLNLALDAEMTYPHLIYFTKSFIKLVFSIPFAKMILQ